jgi:GR25 family glycosyltransferase involved in LPS biosynthesis
MKTKIITLPSELVRQKIIKNSFDDKKIKFEFINGINIEDVKFIKNTPGFIFNNCFLKINIPQLLKYTNRNWIKFGEIGCFLAHYKLYKQLLSEKDINEYLICEDDCKPSINFFIEKFNIFNFSKIDLLYLQSVTAHHQNKQPLVDMLPVSQKEKNIKNIIHNISNICEGTTSYIITKSGAKKFCDYIDNNGYDGPIDNLFTRVPNMELSCPIDVENYFTLENTSKNSSIHSGEFRYNYNILEIILKSNKQLEFVQ